MKVIVVFALVLLAASMGEGGFLFGKRPPKVKVDFEKLAANTEANEQERKSLFKQFVQVRAVNLANKYG